MFNRLIKHVNFVHENLQIGLVTIGIPQPDISDLEHSPPEYFAIEYIEISIYLCLGAALSTKTTKHW